MRQSWRRPIAIAALLVGLALLVFTIRRVDAGSLHQLSRLFGVGLPLALLPGAGWHLVRTEAWRRCFPADCRVRFASLFRVRLAAEAFSYVTIAGVTGEPLKVVLLDPAVRPPIAAASIALERAAYSVVTAAMISVAAALAATTLPLTPRWARIYLWIAGVSAVLAVVPLALVMRRRPARDQSSAGEPAPAATPARRFLRDFARQFRTLATSDRRQLGIVFALEAAAFFAMALEVFAALWLTGTPITLRASIAIETFTRVASIVSAFIPGNVGALEVSNVAAAAAVHAASGGVALALLRRIRGLVWCAAGFAVYPRGNHRGDEGMRTTGSAPRDRDRTLVAIQRADSDAMVMAPLGGMPVGERVARAALRAGYARVLVWTSSSRQGDWRTATRRLAGRLEIVAISDPTEWRRQLIDLDPGSALTLLAPGIVASPQLLASARELATTREHPLFEVPSDGAEAGSGVFRGTAREVAIPDVLALRLLQWRRHGASADRAALESAWLTLDVTTRDDLARAEQILRASIFKPTDGHLGRFNRRLSIPISIALIRHARLSAHAMSAIVIALGLYAGWLFSHGSYLAGVTAALFSWAASVLDGCDGELARLQYKDSAFGCWVDTLGDYVYYLAIFAGLTVGAVRQTGWLALWWCGAALAVGVLLTFALLILLRWRITGGRPERLRTRAKDHFYGSGKWWARMVAKLSTVATRATMPYGIVGFAVLGLLPIVVVLSTIGAQIYWISLAREFRRLVNSASPEGTEVSSAAATESAA